MYHRNIRFYRIVPLKSTFSSRIAQFRFEDLVEGAFHSCPSLVLRHRRSPGRQQRESYGKIRENPTNTNLIGGWLTPLKNMKVSWDYDIPNIWNNKKSKLLFSNESSCAVLNVSSATEAKYTGEGDMTALCNQIVAQGMQVEGLIQWYLARITF